MRMRFLLQLLAICLVAPAFADDASYITIDGVKISKDEYIKLLERTTVTQSGEQQAKAERVVLDQIVSNIVILREAGKLGLVPTDVQVNRLFNIQKKLMEAEQPGKTYEAELAKQGISPEELKADLKVQMAETNLYARKLNLGEAEVEAEYESNKESIGLPARTHMRLIILEPNTPEVKQVQQKFKAGKSFEEVAKTINEPSLLATGGERMLYNSQIPEAVLEKVIATKEGGVIGPIKWVAQPESGKPVALTAWIKVLTKKNAFRLEYADAAPILRRDLVRKKILDPRNISKRNEVLKLKMKSVFESEDLLKAVVWADIKNVATDMGVGK